MGEKGDGRELKNFRAEELSGTLRRRGI